MANTIERICIIGGGPAGLSAAMYLEKKGYTDYDIYENDNRVGGKCCSQHVTMTEDGKVIYPFEPKKNILNGKIFGLIKMKKAVKKLAKLMKTKYAGYAL